ncbi:SpoIIE family protein phosphatase [Virgibacillus sp. MSP4-1]|uniref:PP2C family serine/threonine-protein phosphatase n=1 Tax=Virgibacillus sp. MSP4-1 TaxID=2700081 RepID=UPI00039EA599|nr:PP2C family serine/threonine-protein phosphatase [Virgibacillus sp. MSP4-1]QHS24123.1 SpoIIE family protein phosphatase [Virgibacillus sp. MSP4-1]
MNAQNHRMEVSVFQEAKGGNRCNGDCFFYKETEHQFISVLADGLGSGSDAKESSNAVIEVIENHYEESIDQLIKRCNDKLIHKRGAVLGVLKLNFKNHTYSLTSIGNVGITLIPLNGRKKRTIPTPGYLPGYGYPYKIKREKLEQGNVFLMYSDGVNERKLFAEMTNFNDVTGITDTYARLHQETQTDDTTLMAIRYKAV